MLDSACTEPAIPALASVASRIPGWEAGFERCDAGAPWAAICRTGELPGVAFVLAELGGRVKVVDPDCATIGTASDPDTLIALLHNFLASPRRCG